MRALAQHQYADEQLATVQKRIFLIEFLRLRLIIVYQGLVRIPESKNIRLWRVRKFIYEKLYSHGHFRTFNKNN